MLIEPLLGAVVSVVVSSPPPKSPSEVVSSSEVVEVVEEPPSSLLFLAQESIRPKANAKIVGKKRNFSFFIEPISALGK